MGEKRREDENRVNIVNWLNKVNEEKERRKEREKRRMLERGRVERVMGRRGLRYFRVKTLVFTLEEGEGGRVWIEKIEKGSEHC